MIRLGYGIAAIVFAVDQVSKHWVTHVLELQARGVVAVLPFFDLMWAPNPGVSMSLFRAQTDTQKWLLVAVTLAIAGGVAWWITRERNRVDVTALGLILGGALGNIVDRARFGYVVDFIDLFWRDHHFYIFNVADAGISCGVAVLLLRSVLAPSVKPV
jgi:signal peptidase II